MYAFVAIDTDGNTVKGLTFYEHGETPGLGGEIENPSWRENGWVSSCLMTAAIRQFVSLKGAQILRTHTALTGFQARR